MAADGRLCDAHPDHPRPLPCSPPGATRGHCCRHLRARHLLGLVVVIVIVVADGVVFVVLLILLLILVVLVLVVVALAARVVSTTLAAVVFAVVVPPSRPLPSVRPPARRPICRRLGKGPGQARG